MTSFFVAAFFFLPSTIAAQNATLASGLGGFECKDRRSLGSIIWSCVATTFACTWISVHPNIPALGDSWMKKTQRRAELMFWALMAPELVIMWAVRQWIGARKLAKQYGGDGWTQTHGHFIQMGGFLLHHRDGSRQILSPQLLEDLLERDVIDLPCTTEDDILDRSKGDGLAKGLVLLQTTWFIIQCLARVAQKLAVTELEIVTLAFAALNGVMYFFWWNKPLDVQLSIVVYVKPGRDCVIPKPHTPSPLHFHKEFDTEWPRVLHFVLFMPQLVLQLYHRLGDMVESKRSCTIAPTKLRVPTFYALIIGVQDESSLFYLTAAIASIFGAIHCAAWNSLFPSSSEMILWRSSAAYLSVVPIMVFFSAFIWNICDWPVLQKFCQSFVFVTLAAYIPARLALIVLALMQTRGYPDSAFDVIKWTNFIPHL